MDRYLWAPQSREKIFLLGAVPVIGMDACSVFHEGRSGNWLFRGPRGKCWGMIRKTLKAKIETRTECEKLRNWTTGEVHGK